MGEQELKSENASGSLVGKL
ncbi:RAB9, member RAS oncogene family, isoform CRA_b [Rattus norvegicus]|uniref:RAB9, member RAS oncogene family, isoform CRA_b n=1 Tax=Rattus norvegicus TaxID=10116 RepID=A6K2H6_RAT|nr:RAB9, member RAS oncogene family, isoform CRA_b [Rattus norvegicus]